MNFIRRVFISAFAILLLSNGDDVGAGLALQSVLQQKVIIIMMDGFGEEYYRQSIMPNLNDMEKRGIYKVVSSLMPSVTNVNNAAICTGELPEKNGITGNSFYNEATSEEEFMEDSSLLLSPTIFERAGKKGIKSFLFTVKKKSIGLLSRGASESLSPETASKEWIGRVGAAPSVYSVDANYWLFQAALYEMKHDASVGLYYIHTTDYPMHTWSADDMVSKEHLNKIDGYIKQIREAEPNAMILITADHTVKHKNLCLDIEKACKNKGLTIKIAISAERDKYLVHHRGFGGTSYVYLEKKSDLATAKNIIENMKGVEAVLTREEAAKEFHLMANRIGDLVVLGDDNTVFGNIETEYESLPDGYRTHGSLHEAHVPMFIYNAEGAPAAGYFSSNYKLAAWLFR